MSGFSRQQFSERDIARIARMLRWFEGKGEGRPYQRRPTTRPPMEVILFGELDDDCLDGATVLMNEASGRQTLVRNASGLDLVEGDVVWVGWHWYSSQYYIFEPPSQPLAKGIRFALAAELTTADATSVDAVVLDWWEGADPGETVTLHNYETSTDDEYRWHGASGAVGLADLYFPTGSPPEYIIKDLECPAEA